MKSAHTLFSFSNQQMSYSARRWSVNSCDVFPRVHVYYFPYLKQQRVKIWPIQRIVYPNNVKVIVLLGLMCAELILGSGRVIKCRLIKPKRYTTHQRTVCSHEELFLRSSAKFN